MQVFADLQLHSRFSRAVSQSMTPAVISEWAGKKGINLVATGDWTHPIWLRELKANLVEVEAGVYKQKDAPFKKGPFFLLSTEISSIYSQGGRVHKIHTLVFAPNFGVVEKVNKELLLRGVNLLSDGRPITGLSAKNIAEIALGADGDCLIIPAHAWTPHFSLYGSFSGFDSIEECFGDLSPYIYAIETGLSSDPAMNWKIGELENRKILSFSDAHSPAKMGREATVFEMPKINYSNLRQAIVAANSGTRILYTIEFYPEEGKYHYTGHRNCQVVYSAKETRKLGTTCPVCGKTLTVGVLNRVEQLANQEIEIETEKDKHGVSWIYDKERKRAPYVMLVPLQEIIAEALGVGVASRKVQDTYERMLTGLGSEFSILLQRDLGDIGHLAGVRISEGVARVRSGDITINPGYDGVYGKVSIWPTALDQTSLF